MVGRPKRKTKSLRTIELELRQKGFSNNQISKRLKVARKEGAKRLAEVFEKSGFPKPDMSTLTVAYTTIGQARLGEALRMIRNRRLASKKADPVTIAEINLIIQEITRIDAERDTALRKKVQY